MTKVRFQGFESGSTTSLLAGKAGILRGPVTISAWRAPIDTSWSGDSIDESLTVTVTEVVPSGVPFAPLGVEFRIKVDGSTVGASPADILVDADFEAYDPTFSRVQYVVHTGDSGSYRNERVGDPSHRDKAYQYGQNPGHVYSDPGTYSGRSVYVYDDQGRWGTATLPDLTVLEPEAGFTAATTIVVSNDPDETWAGAPAHDIANRCTSIDQAFARYMEAGGPRTVGKNGDGGVRVCVKAGQTFNEAARTLKLQFIKGRCLFDTWGGSEPILIDESNQPVAFADSECLIDVAGNVWPFAMKNWAFDFGFDVQTGGPTTDPQAAGNYRGLYRGNDTFFNGSTTGLRHVFDRVDVKGTGTAVLSTGSWQHVSRQSAWFFNDCLFQDLNDYLMFQPSNVFFLGCQGMESYGADLGLMGRNRVGQAQRGYRGHRNVRETTAWAIYMRACFWEARGGWSGQNNGSTGYSAQPLMRFHENSSSQAGSERIGKRLYICDSVMMGPFQMDLPSNNSRGGMHSVVENCVLAYDPMTVSNACIDHWAGGKTIRNCMFLCLDTPFLERGQPGLSGRNMSKFETPAGRVNMGPFRRFINFQLEERSQGRPAENLHNTFVMLRPDNRVDSTDGGYELRNRFHSRAWAGPDPVDVETFYELVEGHNVEYAPRLPSPIGPVMDTIAMPAGVRMLDMWMKTVWERQEVTLSAPVAPGETTPEIPYPTQFDGTATTQTDYSGSRGNHAVRTGGADYGQLSFAAGTPGPTERGVITVNFGASGFTITNNSSAIWSGSLNIVLDRGTTCMEADRLYSVDQSQMRLYRPRTSQALSDGVRSTLFDFQRRLRPNAGFAISPDAGTNAAGALLPA